jgi:hypothetical protein
MARTKEPKIEIKADITGADNLKDWCKQESKKNTAAHGTGGAVYGLGLIGSLVYWLQAATSFGAVITAILKSIVWPAYVVYKLLEVFYG